MRTEVIVQAYAAYSLKLHKKLVMHMLPTLCLHFECMTLVEYFK